MVNSKSILRPSFFTRSEGPDHKAVQEAFGWLYLTAKEKGFLAVIGYATLEGVISDVLGNEGVKGLRKVCI